MLCAWGFDRIGVVASDLYFVDPQPKPGQEGAEHGVRLEVRLLERPPLTGTIYAAQPIVIDRPVWRADFLETVEGPPGSHDRTHHHPRFRGWDPVERHFDRGMTDDPIGWLTEQLSDLPGLLERAGMSEDIAGPDESRELAAAAPQIAATVADLLARVRAGELARPPTPEDGPAPASARVSWL
jgi:hypothetical protein